MKDSNTRIRALKMFEILSNETDQDNPMGTTMLRTRLKDYGMECDRKTIYRLIKLLNDTGFEVLCTRGRSNEYYVVNRKFDIPELRILIDAVQSASFITPLKSKELIEKIAALGGSNRSRILKKTTSFDTVKQKNEQIYYNVSALDEGIINKRKVSFKYFDYDDQGKVVYRKNGERYIVNPVTLLVNDNKYYLVCYNDKYKNISSYRIDRMEAVKVEKDKITKAECGEKFNLKEYRKQAFSMFSGKVEKVELVFDEKVIDTIIDKFGSETNIICVGGCKYSCSVKVAVSTAFYAWCCGLGKMLTIKKPQSVKADYIAYLTEVIENNE